MRAHNKRPKVDDLLWILAYRQQIGLMDLFDAEGLFHARQAKKNNVACMWTQDLWERFLNIYGLTQGWQAELRKQRCEVFNAITPIFRPRVNANPVEDLTCRWQCGTEALGRLLSKKRKDGSNPELWSMSSKILWFYQPKRMTLFDKKARQGLQISLGQDITPGNYLERFACLYQTKKDYITSLDRFSNRTYPYPRRILDKWLWLKGDKERDIILQRLKRSIAQAPFRSF